jgi:hypothetical protein
VTPPEMLAGLRARGIELATAGDRLRVRPAGMLTEADREVLMAMKPALLALLDPVTPGDRTRMRTTYSELTPEERDRLAAEAAAGDRLAQLVTDAVLCAPEPCAWRLYSCRLDQELWLARDAKAAAALDADGARAGLPVVLADDLERLRDFDDRRLNDLLDVLIYFPGARIAERDPEAAS